MISGSILSYLSKLSSNYSNVWILLCNRSIYSFFSIHSLSFCWSLLNISSFSAAISFLFLTMSWITVSRSSMIFLNSSICFSLSLREFNAFSSSAFKEFSPSPSTCWKFYIFSSSYWILFSSCSVYFSFRSNYPSYCWISCFNDSILLTNIFFSSRSSSILA